MLVSDVALTALKLRPNAKIKQPPARSIRQGASNITVWVDNESTSIPVSATTSLGDGYYPLSHTNNRKGAMLVHGVPCLPLPEIAASKIAIHRPKDLEDLRAILNHLERTSELSESTTPSPWSY